MMLVESACHVKKQTYKGEIVADVTEEKKHSHVARLREVTNAIKHLICSFSFNHASLECLLSKTNQKKVTRIKGVTEINISLDNCTCKEFLESKVVV